jgi:NAD(P)-dependent dehydrogenase (short-subunit alcohol dehydrogenase family)
VNKYDLEGRTAMVAGGASGIGHAACAQLVRAGARVASLDLQAATGVDVAIIGDVTAREGVIDGDAYAASKAAVVSLARTVGRSVATAVVLVSCVIPRHLRQAGELLTRG